MGAGETSDPVNISFGACLPFIPCSTRTGPPSRWWQPSICKDLAGPGQGVEQQSHILRTKLAHSMHSCPQARQMEVGPNAAWGPLGRSPGRMGEGGTTTAPVRMARNGGKLRASLGQHTFRRQELSLKAGLEVSLWKSPRAAWCLFQRDLYPGWWGVASQPLRGSRWVCPQVLTWELTT